ncbi:uncharacterized protein LOC135388412 isoform X2 [Ornithodoros turicata]|uniref:uncharacterized protein LOC135388412 isoform X2 n=1 Tax=Ornithodoros turicata TaxID=34597 RepID=UPI003139F174
MQSQRSEPHIILDEDELTLSPGFVGHPASTEASGEPERSDDRSTSDSSGPPRAMARSKGSKKRPTLNLNIHLRLTS